jgi:hypothetical protein
MRLPRRPASARDTGTVPAWVPSQEWQRPELVIWGAHGGAGTTTLANWLQPAWDMGAMRSEPNPPYPDAVARGRALLVACRNTASAARQATTAVAAVTRRGGHVTVLVVVSDGWPEPATATSRFRLLHTQTAAVIRIPFVPGLRLADDPADVPLPRQARRALDQIRTITGRPSPAP